MIEIVFNIENNVDEKSPFILKVFESITQIDGKLVANSKSLSAKDEFGYYISDRTVEAYSLFLDKIRDDM